MTNAWFRFYSETLRDRKLERIGRVTGQPNAVLVGVWVTLLALANDSPERGILLLTDDIPLVFDDLCLETGLDLEALQPIIERFIAMEMLSFEDGIYFITNWGKRQFKSDSSAERVRRYRERQVEKGNGTSNDTVTLQEQRGNAPESESDTEADKGASAPTSFDDWLNALRAPKSLGETNGVAVLVRMGQSLYEHFPADGTIYGRVGKLAKKAGSQSKLARVFWENASKPLAVPLDYLTTVVYGKANEHGPAPPKQRTITTGGGP